MPFERVKSTDARVAGKLAGKTSEREFARAAAISSYRIEVSVVGNFGVAGEKILFRNYRIYAGRVPLYLPRVQFPFRIINYPRARPLPLNRALEDEMKNFAYTQTAFSNRLYTMYTNSH